MDIKRRFRRFFKLRFAALYPFGVFIALFNNPSDSSIISGIWFILAGLTLRLWANGYAIKLDKLTTSGPYAFVRHPLYLGTLLIAAGFIIMLDAYLSGILLLSVMAFIYFRTVKKEEEMLKDKFSAAYIDYRKNTPAFIPIFLPYQKGEKWPFSFRRLIESQEYKLFFWMTIIVIAFYLKTELLLEGRRFNAKILSLIIFAVILVLSDLAGEVIKLRKRAA